MKLIYDKKLGKMVPFEPPAPSPAACTKFDQPSKKPLKTRNGPKVLKRGGFLNHSSDGAGVHPDDALKATQHAAAHGHSNVYYDSEGTAHMRNGTARQWRKYLRTIGMHDKMSFQ